VVLKDAAIHDDLYAGGFGTFGSFFVDDPLLEPEIWDFEADDIINDLRNKFGGAEDVDQVDLSYCCGCGIERGIGRLPKDFGKERIHGNDSVAVPLHVAGYTEAGAIRSIRQANNGNGLGLIQDGIDQLRIVQCGFLSSSCMPDAQGYTRLDFEKKLWILALSEAP
jgi:hypothetical protein